MVAGTLRSPWKWEELIVESAVVGGRTRADGKGAVAAAARRPGGRVPLPHRGVETRGAGIGAHHAIRARPAEPGAPARSLPCRSSTRSPTGPTRRCGASGSIGSAIWPARRCGGRRACCRRSPSSGRWPTSGRCRSRRRATCCTIGSSASTGSRRLRRYGRLFVGTPHQARGRSFRVVFVPGLAERVVPQRPREDPLLLDAVRDANPGTPLARQDDRAAAERLLLKIAIGAASERLYLSYPRLDVAETRARVPSFYALDVMRAITGTHSRSSCAGGRRGRRSPARAWRGRRQPIPIARSTTSNTTSRR